jgi:hypothetical protein
MPGYGRRISSKVFSLHLATADLATGDDIENPTDSRETGDSDLLVR